MKPIKAATNSPPVMGLAEAAHACGVSVSTIRRRREELVKLGAAQTAKGWQIPITALIELELMPSTTDALSNTPVKALLKGVTTPPIDTLSDALVGELDALRIKLVDAEKRAAVAEAVAAERERIIHVQEMALRMLEAGTNQPEQATEPPMSVVSEPVLSKLEQTPSDMPQRGGPKPSSLWRRLLSGR